MTVITQAFSDAFQLLASGDEETFAAVQATLSTSGLAMLGCIIPGVPLGFLLGYTRFPGRNMLRILVDTALSFPTVVLGLLVYLLLARQGPFADFELLFTVPGIAIGLALLGLPIVIAHTCLAVEQADRLLAPTLRTLGAGPWQLLFSTVRELRFHLLTACITAFGRVVSEASPCWSAATSNGPPGPSPPRSRSKRAKATMPAALRSASCSWRWRLS